MAEPAAADAAAPDPRDRTLLLSVLAVATAGLVYELVSATMASYLLGDSVTQWSLVIGVYLSAMGLGSWLSKGIERDLHGRFVAIQLGVAWVGGFSATLLFVGFAHLATVRPLLFGLLACVGTMVGLEIPLLLRILQRGHALKDVVARVLAFDYIGSLAASMLFPLLLLPRLGLVRTALLFGIVNVGVALWFLHAFRDEIAAWGRRHLFVWVSGAALGSAFVLAPSIEEFGEAQLYDAPVVFSQRTPYQRLTLTRWRDDVRLYIDGNLQFSSTDEHRYHETLVHPVLAVAPSRKAGLRVLALGGGDGLALREILGDPRVVSADLVDLDPGMTELFASHPVLVGMNRGAFDDPRVTVHNADAMQWLAAHRDDDGVRFDVAIVDLPDPNDFSLGKLYTRAFYRLLASRLADDGVFVVQATSPYLAPQAFWCIVRTLEASELVALPYHVHVPTFGDWGFVLVGKAPQTEASLAPTELAPGPTRRFLTDEMLPGLFVFPADQTPPDVGINQLNEQLLVHYYEADLLSPGASGMTALSRRGLLQGALAGGVIGCPSTATPRPTLAFVGPDPARGHLVREAAARALAPVEQREASVLIVGAGVAGLSAAWRLHRAGWKDVHVLELEDEIGGTARGGSLPRSAYPMGAHYLPAPRPELGALVELLDDLGLVVGRAGDGSIEYDPRAVCRAPVERHRYRGLWHDGLYPGSGADDRALAQFERFRETLRALDRRGGDGRRLFSLPLSHSSDELRALDGLTMAAWLDREGFDDWRVRWLCDYGCRDDYGCTIEQASAFAGLHHFVARGLEDEHDRLLLTWPQGNAALCERIAAHLDLGERLHLATAVLRIDPDDGKLVAQDVANDRLIGWRAQVILWAAPRFVLRHVLPPGRDQLAPDAIRYTPWLVANVEVDERPRGTGAPPSWDNIDIEAPHLGYVVANHLEDLDARGRAGAVLTYYEPQPADDAAGLAGRRTSLLSASLDEVADHVIGQLAAMHGGIAKHVRAVHVCRWGHAMPQPRPGALFGAEAARASEAIGRVLPCAADTGGLPLFEQAFAQGVGAAEEALARLGRGEAAMFGIG